MRSSNLVREEKMLACYEKRQLVIYQMKETRRLLAEELIDEDEDGVPNIEEVVGEPDNMISA